MRRFVFALYQSLYNAAWLKAQRFAAKDAWKFFALVVFLVTAVAMVPVVVGVPGVAGEMRKAITDKIPDFTATVKGGALTIAGVAQPFVLRDNEQNFLFYLDTVTTSTLSAEDFATGTISSVALVTAKQIQIYNGEQNSQRIQSFAKVGEGMFSKADLVTFVSKITGVPAQILVALFIGLFFYIGVFINKLIVILFASLMAMLVGKLRGVQWKFGEYFTIGLFAITVPSIISIVAGLVGLQIAFLQFIALFAFMVAIVWSGEAAPKQQV